MERSDQPRDDNELWQDFVLKGREESFHLLVQRHKLGLFNATYRILYDTHAAEDVVQRVFVTLIERKNELAEVESLQSWLYRATFNQALNMKKLRRRTRDQERAGQTPSTPEMPRETAARAELREELDRALAKLKHSLRIPLILRYLQGMSHAETGEVLGLSSDATRKRISRALKRLRKLLSGRGLLLSLVAVEEGLRAVPAKAASADFLTSTSSLLSVASTGAAAGEAAISSTAVITGVTIMTAKVKIAIGIFAVLSVALLLTLTLRSTQRELRSRIGHEEDPEKVIAIMNHYIFAERGYGSRQEDEYDPEVSLSGGAVDQEKRTCTTVWTLYLAIGERLGMPLFGVTVPLHLFVRYDAGDTKINIEATDNGACVSDPEYIISWRVPQTPSGRSFYMRNLSKREVLGILLSKLATLHGSEGRLDQAVRASRKVLAIIPSCREAWVGLGNLYARNGQPDNTIEAYKRALAIAPDSIRTWNRLGLAYEDQEKYSEAVEAYKRAIAIDLESTESWCNIGFAYGQLEQLDQAIESYRKAVQIDPNLAEAWYALGSAYSFRKPDEAVSAHNKALEIDPDFPEARHDLAFIYYITGRRGLARKLDPDLLASFGSDPGAEDSAGSDCFRTMVLLTIASMLFALLEIRLHRRRRTTGSNTTEATTGAA